MWRHRGLPDRFIRRCPFAGARRLRCGFADAWRGDDPDRERLRHDRSVVRQSRDRRWYRAPQDSGRSRNGHFGKLRGRHTHADRLVFNPGLSGCPRRGLLQIHRRGPDQRRLQFAPDYHLDGERRLAQQPDAEHGPGQSGQRPRRSSTSMRAGRAAASPQATRRMPRRSQSSIPTCRFPMRAARPPIRQPSC